MSTTAPSDATLTALSGLSAGLWRIQELLELLTYKLEVQHVLIETGRSRWMGRSTREIEVILQEMREAELMRAVDAGPVCDALGLPLDTPLTQIAEAAPAPWNQVLSEHRVALSNATNELSLLSRSNSEMLEASYKAVQETLDRFNHTSEGATYTATGARESRRSHHLFDQKS
ncbi:FlgN family protein [Kineosphaera limosa NBRC 100340]|uniref:FlgN family protein n=1 Tax=Kineosphaera limosa NBRC 100340 TaxID=1184609 RepID=K6VQ44_9MICO|nr:flagellar export chaperone FlgN [Kineosphaera limosa]GAB98298.1 FlgN family protein [Kineosphaera limosa NBRC 100340]